MLTIRRWHKWILRHLEENGGRFSYFATPGSPQSRALCELVKYGVVRIVDRNIHNMTTPVIEKVETYDIKA